MRYTILLLLFPLFSFGQLSLHLESGIVFTQYNDVRVPNSEDQQGTLFSLSDDFAEQRTTPFFRAELAYLINNKHTLELTAAPLQINYENATLDSINFAGSVFNGNEVNGRYEFNTYRLSYRYRFIDKENLLLDLGASILVRDARIALSQNDLVADDTDLGFVPLISFRLDYSPNDRLSLLLKGDALVGPQGRAEDVFAGVSVDLWKNQLRLKTGYRLIEGGADVDQVYNFAFIHFASLGIIYQP